MRSVGSATASAVPPPEGVSVRYVRHNASVSDPIRDEQTPLVSLGPAGPRVSPIGVGTWQWGERGYWGCGRDYGEDHVRAAYQRARAAGVTLFDTAETYGRGRSEQLLGRFVAERSDVGLVVVATKFAPLPWRARRRGPLRRALEASLGRLGLDSIGLYQIHWPLPLVGDEPWLADLADAAGDALVGAVGVQTTTPPSFGKRIARSRTAALPWPPTRSSTACWTANPSPAGSPISAVSSA